MNFLRGFFILAAVAATAAVTSCTPYEPSSTTVKKPTLYHWDDDGGPGEVKIKINLVNQKALYTRGGRPIGWSYVATGTSTHPTPTGSFRITEKVVDKYSNAYGWIEDEYGNVVNGDAQPSTPVPAGCRYVAAPMPYWMRLTNYGIGMHAGLIPNPGSPASHGCIRLPKPLAPVIYDAVKVGTRVQIVREAPSPPPAAPAATPGVIEGVDRRYEYRTTLPNPNYP